MATHAIVQDDLRVCPLPYLDSQGRLGQRFLVCHGPTYKLATRTRAPRDATVFDAREQAEREMARPGWVVPEKCDLVLPTLQEPAWTSYTLEGYRFHVVYDDSVRKRRRTHRNPAHIPLSMELRETEQVDWTERPVEISYLCGDALLLVENEATHALVPYDPGCTTADARTIFRRVFARRLSRLAECALTHILNRAA